MSRQTISLKSRVRYERRAQTFDRRTSLEQLPDPMWYTVGQVMRQNFRRIVRGPKGGKTPSGR